MKRLFSKDTIWPVGLTAAMVVFIAINIAFVTVAFRNRPQLVSENYYAEGYNLKEITQRDAASQATGWTVTIRSLPLEQADMPLAELTVKEASGTPCDSLAGQVGFYRPSDKTLDRAPLPIQYVGTGRYLIYLPHALERGAWQAQVDLKRDRQAYSKRISFFVD